MIDYTYFRSYLIVKNGIGDICAKSYCEAVKRYYNAIGITNPGAKLHIQTTASEEGLMVQGAASQSAVLAQLRGTSSTGAGRQHLDIDAEFADSTDATRKSIAYLRVWDTAAREALRMEADGSAARLGFFGVSAVNRPQVTASGVSASDLLTALNSLGLLESI